MGFQLRDWFRNRYANPRKTRAPQKPKPCGGTKRIVRVLRQNRVQWVAVDSKKQPQNRIARRNEPHFGFSGSVEPIFFRIKRASRPFLSGQSVRPSPADALRWRGRKRAPIAPMPFFLHPCGQCGKMPENANQRANQPPGLPSADATSRTFAGLVGLEVAAEEQRQPCAPF